MTPETKQVPAGYFRRPRMSPGGAAPGALPDTRSPDTHSPDTRSPGRDAAAWPPPAFPPPAFPPPMAMPQPTTVPVVKRAKEDGSIVGVIPYLAVLLCTIAGVYVAWHQGSAGGGKGGVVGGVALLVAAVMRLVLPARLVGLLGTRNRAIDVLTLAIFGAGLLIAGLVLPR
jgi:Protein of unknown function (DUF3017)